MKKLQLDIVALSHSVTQSHNYAVVLGETEGNRRLPIVIGGFEAQAIAVAIEKMSPNRPLTHDLFKNTLDSFGIQLTEIVINNLLDGIFYAKMVCVKDGEVIEIDSRTSDAIAMAVRFSCPIYTFEFIMEAAGVVLEGDAKGEEKMVKKAKPKKQSYETMSVAELNGVLNELIDNEDYEKAARIRDEINKRKGESS